MRSRGAAVWARIILIVAGLGVAGFLYAFPLYWLVATSLKSKAELYQSITLFPQHPTLNSYASVLFDRGFWVLLKNSVLVCAATVLVTLAVGLVITYPIRAYPYHPNCASASSTGRSRFASSRRSRSSSRTSRSCARCRSTTNRSP